MGRSPFHFILFLAFTGTLSHQVAAFQEADTVDARAIVEVADSLYYLYDFDSAQHHYLNAERIYADKGTHVQHAWILNKVMLCYMALRQPNEALRISRQALRVAQSGEQVAYSELATTYYYLGAGHYGKHEYDDAIAYYEKSISIRKDHLPNSEGDIAPILMSVGQVWVGRGELKKARPFYEEALRLQRDSGGEMNETTATYYSFAGNIYWRLGQFEKALDFKRRALEINQEVLGPSHRSVASMLDQVGSMYMDLGDYDLAIKYQMEGVQVLERLDTESFQGFGKAYSNLGRSYIELGHNDKALSYFTKALEVWTKTYDSDHHIFAFAYHNLGNVWMNFGRHAQAVEYLEKAISIRTEAYGKEHDLVADLYVTLGQAYLSMGNTSQALAYLQAALRIQRKELEESYMIISATLSGIGECYLEMGDHSQALGYYSKAIASVQQAEGDQSISLASDYVDMGDALSNLDRYDEAADYFALSESLLRRKGAEGNSLLDYVYYRWAASLMQQMQWDESMDFIDRALAANTGRQSEGAFQSDSTALNTFTSIKDTTDPLTLLQILKLKAKLLMSGPRKPGATEQLMQCVDVVMAADSLVGDIRYALERHEDRLVMAENAATIYDLGIAACFALNELTGEERPLHQAFEFMERSKSTTLSTYLMDSYARHAVGVPDSLLDQEQTLRVTREFYRNRIMTAPEDTSRVSRWKNELFQANARYDSFIVHLEKAFPRYHELKYRSDQLTVEDIQQSLRRSEALVAYFESDSVYYAFALSSNDFSARVFARDSLFDADNLQFVQTLGSPNLSDNPDVDTFRETSYKLWTRVLQPSVDLLKGADRLVIIPDGALSYFPFELMVTHDPEGTSTNYLLHDYAVSYAYSANLLFGEFYAKQKRASKELIAFAPTYGDVPAIEANLPDRFRDEIGPLAWNDREVDAISQFFEGSFLIDSSANEQAFKKEVNDYRLVHLAMHALVDDEEPMRSKLVFTATRDTVEDDMLHPFELMNMELGAELTVLSACKTGFGQLRKGEGVISLGRAFSYAGCPSVVMSHWSVDDRSTSEVMVAFYKYLSEGYSKDVALQKAKLDFLQSAQGVEIHPYYWGAFVVMGDTAPIKSRIRWEWYLVLGVGLLLIVGLQLRRGRRDKASSEVAQ